MRDIIFQVIFLSRIISGSTAETEKIGYNLGKTLPRGCVVAMFGDLGAGKTSFTRGFAAGMGIEADVTSPTFAIMNDYYGNGRHLYHFDMYRVSGYDDLYSTGYFDYSEGDDSVIIEWSENIEEFLPDDCVRITLTKTDNENERLIDISGFDYENTLD